MKKKDDFIIVTLFILFIYGIVCANILTVDKEFSEMENRMLTQKPQFILGDILSGDYMEEYETYITDQFVARDMFVGIKSAGERTLGKKENNGVYYGKDGYLIEQLESVDEALVKRNAEAVKRFADCTQAEVAFALIPGSVELNRDKLFEFMPDLNQKEMIDTIYGSMLDSKIICADMYKSLNAHRDEEIYYRTDHHWTSLGAYYGYCAFAEAMGFAPIELNEYERELRSEEFYGTLYSKNGAFWLEPDSIFTYVDAEGIVVERIEGNVTEKGELYDLSKLAGKDKYSMFLGGNQPLVVLKTENTELPKLLVIRDSYSDSLAPFLTAHYSEIYMWDFRYNKDSVSDFIEANDIEDVFICYSIDNFQEDSNIAFVLSKEQ